jgi:hypothetical protein
MQMCRRAWKMISIIKLYVPTENIALSVIKMNSVCINLTCQWTMKSRWHHRCECEWYRSHTCPLFWMFKNEDTMGAFYLINLHVHWLEKFS